MMHSLRRLFALTLLASAIVPASGRAVEPASEDLVTRFQESVDGLRNHYDLPGATASFVLADGSRGDVASGFADLEASVPMTTQSRMLAASIGKTFVGMTLVALAEDGLLDLDAPLSDWLAERDWFDRLPNHETVTLRHLLTHTAGVPDHVRTGHFAAAVAEGQDRAAPTPEALIAFVLDLPPDFPAGEGWAYSDSGYILLGLACPHWVVRFQS